MKQDKLLALMEQQIVAVFTTAKTKGWLSDAVRLNQLPIRQCQAFMLTSDVFLGMSVTDAADIMGIKPQVVSNYLQELKLRYPHIATFLSATDSTDRLGSLRRPLSIDMVDYSDEDTVRVF